MSQNTKSYLGIDKLYYALVTDSSDAYVPGTPEVLAPVGAITNAPAANNKVQFFDNIPMESLNSVGPSKLSIEIQGLPLSLQAILLGNAFDVTNGLLMENGTPPPYVAVGFRALKTDGTYRYYWFLKGTFAPPSEDLATKTDTPDPKTIKLEYTAIRTTRQFVQTVSLTDSSKFVQADDSDIVVDPAAWFAAVRVPTMGSPAALTATPSPVDGATGAATTVPISITFSNALAAHAELGVTLTRVDTGAVIAVTRSLNAGRTVLTLAHAALTSAKQYFITISGVKDVYGQTLADVVYDFTIA